MTKVKLAKAIEDDGRYYHVGIDSAGDVTGVPAGESSHYSKDTNTGGRRYLGTYDELSKKPSV